MQSKAAVNKELESTKKRLEEKNFKVAELLTRLSKARKELQDLRGELYVKNLQTTAEKEEPPAPKITKVSSGGSILDLLGNSEDQENMEEEEAKTKGSDNSSNISNNCP